MHRYRHKESRITKNLANMTASKETNKALITDPKEVEIYKLSNNSQ